MLVLFLLISFVLGDVGTVGSTAPDSFMTPVEALPKYGFSVGTSALPDREGTNCYADFVHELGFDPEYFVRDNNIHSLHEWYTAEGDSLPLLADLSDKACFLYGNELVTVLTSRTQPKWNHIFWPKLTDSEARTVMAFRTAPDVVMQYIPLPELFNPSGSWYKVDFGSAFLLTLRHRDGSAIVD